MTPREIELEEQNGQLDTSNENLMELIGQANKDAALRGAEVAHLRQVLIDLRHAPSCSCSHHCAVIDRALNESGGKEVLKHIHDLESRHDALLFELKHARNEIANLRMRLSPADFFESGGRL